MCSLHCWRTRPLGYVYLPCHVVGYPYFKPCQGMFTGDYTITRACTLPLYDGGYECASWVCVPGSVRSLGQVPRVGTFLCWGYTISKVCEPLIFVPGGTRSLGCVPPVQIPGGINHTLQRRVPASLRYRYSRPTSLPNHSV